MAEGSSSKATHVADNGVDDAAAGFPLSKTVKLEQSSGVCIMNTVSEEALAADIPRTQTIPDPVHYTQCSSRSVSRIECTSRLAITD